MITALAASPHADLRLPLLRFFITLLTHKLPTDQFARVHRSYTIALDKINGIDGNCVDINGKLIPVSRENRQEVFRKLGK